MHKSGRECQHCATCHGNFHTLSNDSSDGVGATASSPFIRHPTDFTLPNSGEYSHYTTYNLDAPIGRTGALSGTASSTVTPGSDAVTCLSCHVSHASDYPDMLRWDYNDCSAVSTDKADCGCFACHTTKDD